MPQLHPSPRINPRSETVRIILNLRHHHPACHHRRRRQPQTVPCIRIIHHQPPQPHKVPIHIQTDQIVRRKQRIHMLPVRTRRRRSIARLRMTHRPPRRPELPLPDQLPIPIPKTQHMQPLLLRPARRRHIHPTTTHQRRRQPPPRQRRLPRHPIRSLKRPRRIAPLTSIPTRPRPPELQPVRRSTPSHRQERKDQQQSHHPIPLTPPSSQGNLRLLLTPPRPSSTLQKRIDLPAPKVQCHPAAPRQATALLHTSLSSFL